ncbi:MAG: outer membrane lipoprotein-sorting protein [Verrucomicrobiota bacterium]
MKALRMAFVLLLSLSPVRGEEPLTATEIVRRSDDLNRGAASYAALTMDIIRPEWKRSLTMEGWSQGASNSFIRILSPRKEKGVTFLKKGREAWQYVPAIDRTIKIPPSMMLQSWLGSDFTNDDVVRADSVVVDYTHRITGEDESSWVIEATPKENAPVVWGKLIFHIAKINFVSGRVDYYDEEGEKIKTYRSEGIQKIEGREVPLTTTMVDLKRPGYRTVLLYLLGRKSSK